MIEARWAAIAAEISADMGLVTEPKAVPFIKMNARMRTSKPSPLLGRFIDAETLHQVLAYGLAAYAEVIADKDRFILDENVLVEEDGKKLAISFLGSIIRMAQIRGNPLQEGPLAGV